MERSFFILRKGKFFIDKDTSTKINIDYRDKSLWTVYVHITPNNKYYVGITSKNVRHRWGANGCGYKTQVFFKAIQKYGWNNIQHEIVAEHLTLDEAQKMEITLIKLLDSKINAHGYNVSNGGDRGNDDISGENNPFYGKHHTEETKEKMRKNHWDNSGANNYMYGKHHTKEAKKKIASREYKKGKESHMYGHSLSDQQKEIIRQARSIPVCQLSIDLNLIRKFNSATEAAKITGFNRSMISAACRKEFKTYQGYIWCYLSNIDNPLEYIRKNPIKPSNGIAVMQFDLDGSFIAEYQSSREAERVTGIDHKSILKKCSSKQKSASGFIWKYKNQSIKEDI